MRTYRSAAFINSAVGHSRTDWVERGAPVVTYSLSQFVNAIDDFRSLFLLSASIYRRAEFIASLPAAYFFAEAFAPHLCLLFARLVCGPAECVLHHAKLVAWGGPPPDEPWDSFFVLRGIYKMIGLIDDPGLCRTLFDKIYRHCPLLLPWWKTLALWMIVGTPTQQSCVRDYFVDWYRLQLLAGHRVTVRMAAGLLMLSALARSAPVLRIPARAYFRLKHGPSYHPGVRVPNYGLTILKGKRY